MRSAQALAARRQRLHRESASSRSKRAPPQTLRARLHRESAQRRSPRAAPRLTLPTAAPLRRAAARRRSGQPPAAPHLYARERTWHGEIEEI